MLPVAVFFVAGTLFGSFINAVSWRFHEGMDFVRTRSQCVNCSHKLAAKDLIPILSWILLAGRCRYCGQPISRRYPVVELITGGLFALSFASWDFSTPFASVALGFWLAITVGLMLLAEYDLRWMLLPDKILLPLAALAVVKLVTLAILTRDLVPMADALLASLLASLFFYGLYAYSRGRWMGGGDVKLVFVMGLILGLANTSIALLVAFNTAALLSLALIATRRMTRKDHIPFGPFLIGGTIVAMLYGTQLFELYRRLLLIT